MLRQVRVIVQQQAALGRGVDEAVIGGDQQQRVGAGDGFQEPPQLSLDLAQVLARAAVCHAALVRKVIQFRPVGVHVAGRAVGTHQLLKLSEQATE